MYKTLEPDGSRVHPENKFGIYTGTLKTFWTGNIYFLM
jgi:hypothetical protein